MPASIAVVTLHDDTTIEVPITLEDSLAFEVALRRNKRWGTLSENSIRMITFRAWNALQRTGQTEQSWEEFSSGPNAALDVTMKPTKEPDKSDDDEDGEVVESVGKAGRKGRSTASS